MGFLLLWIESLTVSLLFMAWITACVGRWQRRWIRAIVWMPIALLLLLPYSLVAVVMGILKFRFTPGHPFFYYFLGLALALLVGIIVLRVKGLRRTGVLEWPTEAAQWPRGKLFAALCIAAVLHVVTVENLDSAVCRQIEAIREESRKTLTAVVPPVVSEADNALPLYEKANEALRLWEHNRDRWLEEKMESFDAKDPELRAFMQEREPVVLLLQAAAKRPAYVVPPDPKEPGCPQFCPMANLHEPALFLAAHCRCKLAEGNRQAAWQDVRVLFRLAEQSRQGMAYLSRASWRIEQLAIESLQFMLAAVQPTPDELASIKIDEFLSWRRDRRASFPADDALLLRLMTEFGAKNIDGRQAFTLPPAQAMIANTAFYRIFFFPADMVIYRRVMQEIDRQLTYPYSYVSKITIPDMRILENPINVGAFAASALRLGAFLDDPGMCAKADARHAAALVGLAAARYQAKYGRLPKDLKALVPEFLTTVPLDPFDVGVKPMKYKITDSGAVIYSIGRDRPEKHWERSAWERKKPDMTFELPRWKP
jgi:hypothetical protein